MDTTIYSKGPLWARCASVEEHTLEHTIDLQKEIYVFIAVVIRQMLKAVNKDVVQMKPKI